MDDDEGGRGSVITLPAPPSGSDRPTTADAHTRDRFRWLDQVLADQAMTPFAFAVAYALSSHVNRDSGEAWPSQSRLAEIVGSTDRGVRKAVEQLAARGHLKVYAPTGRKTGNRYRPILKEGAEVIELHRNGGSGKDGLHRNGGAGNGASHRNGGSYENPVHRNGGSGLTGTVVPPNPLNEPSEGDLSPQAPPKAASRKVPPKADGACFDELWEAYPRKVGKDAAVKAYAAAIGRGALHADIMAGVKRYAGQRRGQDPKFTAHPSTWLNGGRWKDEEPTTSAGAAATGATVEIRGVPVPEANVLAGIRRWREGGSWHAPWGPPPDDPRCQLPRRLIERVGAAS